MGKNRGEGESKIELCKTSLEVRENTACNLVHHVVLYVVRYVVSKSGGNI
jgi:hypothetical protein